MTTSAHRTDVPFTVHPRRAGDPEPDLTGFELTHRAMRTGTRLIASAARACSCSCSDERRAAIVWFVQHLLTEIHAHHRKEDEILWPVIVASAGGRVDLAPLTADHTALEDVLVRADEIVARYATDRRDTGATRELADVMTEIADELDEHIADEEATVFPVMREFVSAADFARCERMFQRGTALRHLLFVLPWFVGQCTPQERAALLPSAPLPMRMLLRLAEPRWQRRVALVAAE